jgi:hypothetical protein
LKNLKKAAVVTLMVGGLAAAGAGVASAAGADAVGSATQSPGVKSGNVLQAPKSVPVNIVGNTTNAFALLNPAFGNAGTIL